MVAEESTTPDLVERARHFFAALNNRDWDALMRFYAPNAVYELSGGTEFHGAAEIRQFSEDLVGTFDDLTTGDSGGS